MERGEREVERRERRIASEGMFGNRNEVVINNIDDDVDDVNNIDDVDDDEHYKSLLCNTTFTIILFTYQYSNHISHS